MGSPTGAQASETDINACNHTNISKNDNKQNYVAIQMRVYAKYVTSVTKQQSHNKAMQISRHQLLGDHCGADSEDGNEMLSRRGSAEQGPQSDVDPMPASVLRT